MSELDRRVAHWIGRKIEGLSSGNRADDVPALETYKVVYLGGHPDFPKAKAGTILFALLPDAFRLSPTTATKNWFGGLFIPYSEVRDLQIVGRQVSTLEGILGGLDSRQLNQDNNIHITYRKGDQEILLRLEMLTGVTVMGRLTSAASLKTASGTWACERSSPTRRGSPRVPPISPIRSPSFLHSEIRVF